MRDALQPGGREAEDRAFLDSLANTVRSGSPRANDALTELSGIAMGGHLHAQRLIAGIDADVSAGRLALPPSSVQTLERSGASDWQFFAEHPVAALNAAFRQFLVSIEASPPPPEHTIEGFSSLSVEEAAAVFHASSPKRKSFGYLPPDRNPGDFLD